VTILDTGFVGEARRIDDVDLPRIASAIGAGEDELHAFIDVETGGGDGFDSRDRPTALYEPHVAYRCSSGATRSALVAAGLAYQNWGEQPYPKDSYPRILAAARIDLRVACLATSWGMTQILGENYAMCGYDSPEAMVGAFMDDAEHHLEACVQFLIASGIADDLVAHRWAVVARVYNGPGYAKNSYDTKMAARFAWWAKIPDTPYLPSEGPVAGYERPVLRRNARGADVVALQQLLIASGLQIAADGDFGPRTEGAVKTFQGRAGLTMDGIVGRRTWTALDSAVSV